MKTRYRRLEKFFEADHALFWNNLSRFNNLMVIVNISMFFLTGLVSKGYYYTFYSLILLGVVGVAGLIPTVLIRRFWYYGVFFMLECIGLYFLTASIVYWIQSGGG